MEYQRLTLINTGTSRQVFSITNDLVIKVAINEKGITQNQQEVEISLKFPLCEEIAKIISYDANYRWVIQERVNTLNKEKFLELFKMDAHTFLKNLRHRKNLTSFHKPIDKAITDLNLDRFEICNGLTNIGEKNKKLIILDYGIIAKSTVKSPSQAIAGIKPMDGEITPLK